MIDSATHEHAGTTGAADPAATVLVPNMIADCAGDASAVASGVSLDVHMAHAADPRDCTSADAPSEPAQEDLDRVQVGTPADSPALVEISDLTAAMAAQPSTVFVLDERKEKVQYVLTEPHSRFAACSCEAATQRKMCKHQVACLLATSCNPSAAERAIFHDLGHVFGRFDGCSERSIKSLTSQLLAQPPFGALPARAPAVPASAVQQQENDAEAQQADGADALDSSPSHALPTPAPRPLSDAVLSASLARMQEQLSEAISNVRAAPAEQQESLLANIDSHIKTALSMSLKGRDGHAFAIGVPDFQRESGSVKRKKSFLSGGGRKKKKKSGTQQQVPARPDLEAQADFMHSSQLKPETVQISKVFKQHKTSAKAAAADVQRWLNQQPSAVRSKSACGKAAQSCHTASVPGRMLGSSSAAPLACAVGADEWVPSCTQATSQVAADAVRQSTRAGARQRRTWVGVDDDDESDRQTD